MTQNDSTNFPDLEKNFLLTEEMKQWISDVGATTIDAAAFEFVQTKPTLPQFQEIKVLNGICIKWDENFILKVLIALATDNMESFTRRDEEIWNNFVNFQDLHTHSAIDSDANNTAVGCTIPNSNYESFVVTDDGSIMNGENGKQKIKCQPPEYIVQNADVWKSLDNLFMAMLNCQEVDNCNRDNYFIQNNPCSTNT